RLLSWLAFENDTLRTIAMVVPPEVVSVQEQEHAPARLIPNARFLLGRRGTCQQQATPSVARGCYHHPALRLLRDRRVLDQLEAERVDEKPDRLVVVADDEGNHGE